MEEVFAKLQLIRRIAGANHATRCQRCSYIISCKAISNSSNRTALCLHRSMPNSGQNPRRTVPTRQTSAESSSTRQRAEDYSPRCTLNIASRCRQETVSAVLQPEP